MATRKKQAPAARRTAASKKTRTRGVEARIAARPRPKAITMNELKAMMYDLDTPDEKIRAYLTLDKERSNAFTPVITANSELVEAEVEEAAVALSIFNSISRWRRQARYRRKIADGFQGVKIVSEGDSWFQYPWLLEDVIDQLFDEYAIFSLGAAGDELRSIILSDEYTAAIRAEQPNIFLISGGGNDLFADGRLATMLHPMAAQPEDYPNANFDQLLVKITNGYRFLFTRLTNEFPDLRVLCHGYDYAIPDRGPWLGDPMASIGITDETLQRNIIRVLVDRFSAALADAADDFPRVHVVETRDVVGGRWKDELHPENEGFADVADQFRTVISAVTSPERRSIERVATLCPGREAQVEEADDLTPDEFRRLVARRARTLGIDSKDTLTSEETRKATEVEISAFFEKIHLGADFLPAKFLRDGAKRAEAVCRIRTPGSLGTGFLIASRTFIMTNNHVLPNADVARGSVAEFGFEDGGDVTRVGLDPDRLFITDSTLDFTIVGCDARQIGEADAIPLLRNPASVTRGEAVNIIQHPNGRAKEIAIHNNDVIRVQNRVVRYRTDTEPGSSGSPVFNNEWDLVALHHAGWSEAGGEATNEGIRMSAVVAHLLGRRASGDESAEAAHELLSLVPDSSPYLGFFDIVGVEGDGLEVEVPDFRGVPDFADVGFWNIEHFNASVSDTRIGRVGKVLDRLSMDAIGLVEVEAPALERLVADLRARGNDMAFEAIDVRGRQDLAVLYDRDTTVVELKPEIAQRNNDLLTVRTPGGKSAFPRPPLFAHCLVEDDNRQAVEFLMIVVHLKAFGDPVSRERRRLAAQSLAQVITDVRESERLPVILGGDFNESLNNDVLAALSHGTPDLFALTSDDAQTNAISYVGRSHHSLIDHIVVSGDVRPGMIQGDDAAIVRLDRRIKDFSDDVSDHVPVVMRVLMREAPVDVPQVPSEPASMVVTGEITGDRAQIEVPAGISTLNVTFD